TGTLPANIPGSIASKLADTIAHIPLCIVGGQPETTKVHVAFDQSRGIRRGLEHMEPLLSRSLQEIFLCHIVRPLSVYQPANATYFTQKNEAYWLDENSRKIIPAMVAVKQLLIRAGFDQEKFRTAIMKEKTSRADSICKEADAAGAGTIIVGRRGTTTVDMFAMGRVTRKIYYMSTTDRAIWIV
ncbi:MAG TPA: universal stress protein, partial [Desulfosarcina sp.]|nr:universal stress protein [Desulfosarcina sp.]